MNRAMRKLKTRKFPTNIPDTIKPKVFNEESKARKAKQEAKQELIRQLKEQIKIEAKRIQSEDEFCSDPELRKQLRGLQEVMANNGLSVTIQ